MSPGCADMGGVFIVPVLEEYHKITPELLSEMVEEISLSREEEARIISRFNRRQPLLDVGIMSAEEIEFEVFADGKGVRKAVLKDGMVEYEGQLYPDLYFKAPSSRSMFADPAFALHGVTIGVKFHWERQETQQFAGDLKIIVDGNRLRAINIVGIEDYLLSVISSEMSATASEEFLKAHAVISRSWVMLRMMPHDKAVASREVDNLPKLTTWLYSTRDVKVRTTDEYVKWYDHDDHKLFHVCADDHCQRYQGLSRAVGETVRKVIDQTWGQVLTCDGEICDARFSKCCGGVMETFSTCWQDKDYPYLQPLHDSPGHNPESECFCNTQDKEILGQVLNNYDQETVDFYKWTETLDPAVLGELIERKFGVMTGPVKYLEPLERGESGRICKLRIVGELKTITVGKELEIRRILSKTHLKSSAFDVEYTSEGKIVLHGRGWGHGVGLCQIGAAVMATRGYDYRQILTHYYPGSDIVQQTTQNN
jgi:SpoIID/LytB domain protein